MNTTSPQVQQPNQTPPHIPSSASFARSPNPGLQTQSQPQQSLQQQTPSSSESAVGPSLLSPLPQTTPQKPSAPNSDVLRDNQNLLEALDRKPVAKLEPFEVKQEPADTEPTLNGGKSVTEHPFPGGKPDIKVNSVVHFVFIYGHMMLMEEILVYF